MPAPPVASKSTHVFTVRKNPKKPAPAKTARKNFFSPSLKLQRQAYCLETLRLHGIRSVFEIGCGEGDLLAALCEPASHRDEFPPHVAPESRGRSADLKRTIPRTPDNERELHIDRLAGIDINIERLWAAKEATKPPVEDPDEDFELTFGRRERWEPLRVDLWQGSFAYYEEAIDGYEAVVASEVIEHLHEETLSKFGPIVLGRYRPRIVVVTTPNYDFNALFPPPEKGAPPNKNHTLDPTGRTHRYFRDDDHKFEFTGHEFRVWAKHLASQHDYTVTFGGVGRATAFTRDADADPDLCATQCAVFKRLYANEAERAPRSPRTTPLAFLASRPPALAPVLRATHIFPVDLSTEPDVTPHAFRAARLRTLIAKAFYDDVPDLRLRDLWGGSASLRVAAAGQIGLVVDAVASAPAANRWSLAVRPGGHAEGEPRFYAEDAVWIVRTTEAEAAKAQRKAVDGVPVWTSGSAEAAKKNEWEAIRAADEEDDESSDAYRRRGRVLSSSSEDEEWE